MTMDERPLLVFPEPAHADRERRFGGGGRVRMPEHSQQAQRLAPQFQELQQALEYRRATLRDSSTGIQPEQALVLETVGSIDGLIRAIRRIDGLDWLGEFELADIEPDHGFHDESDPDRPLRGQLFLVMTNQRALREIQRLFDRWKENPNAMFPYGLARLKSVFAHLVDIRPWGEEDRIRDTGLDQDWSLRLDNDERVVPFEAELWYRPSPDHRQQAVTYLRETIESLDGEVTQQCVIDEIGYHAILGTVSSRHVPELIEVARGQGQDARIVSLLRCDEVMHFRPVGQCSVLVPEDDADDTNAFDDADLQEVDLNDPVVALFDGMPLTGHNLLANRLLVDDPDGYESAYQANERIHGTTMASLICHGDLNMAGPAITRKLYVRPIMKPRPTLRGPRAEHIPLDVLPVDLIHRAVRRLFESEDGAPPVASKVRVINLSIGDRHRPLNREVSPIARLLDWLAWKYKVLFIVSAGNHEHDIMLDMPSSKLLSLSSDERQETFVKKVASDTRHRRLLSPAETLNGLTIGALHADVSLPVPNPQAIDPFSQSEVPSVTSAHGPGYRRSIKPDILLPGGRQFLYERRYVNGSTSVLSIDRFQKPPGQCVAVPGNGSQLGQTSHTRGTSNAAAMASHGANIIYDSLRQLRTSSDEQIPSEYDAVLIKALITHSANWENLLPLYGAVLRNSKNSRFFRDYVSRFLGYGSADLEKVANCTEQRVTLLGFGAIGDGDGDIFSLPLPPSLSAVTHKRRLTVTLAWLTPVNIRRQNYRIAHLWFNPKNSIAPTRQFGDHRAVQRGTVQHEVLEGERALPFQDGDTMAIKVNCRSDAGNITEPICYGLAVTLEVAESLNLPIYQEVRDRIAVPVQIQDRVAPRI